jgi:cobalt-zinc-cadmium resistance protein CzcA
MIELLLGWALRNRFLVLTGTAILIVAGLATLRELPIDAVPDITNVQVQVLTKSPALGPEQVEKLITTPIEQALGGMPKLEQLRSTSKFGLSVVTAVFEEDTSIYFARQLISERLQQAREGIPQGLGEPEMGPISTGLGEIYQFELRAKGEGVLIELANRLRRTAATRQLGDSLATSIRERDADAVRMQLLAVTDPILRHQLEAAAAWLAAQRTKPMTAMELRSILEFEISPRLRAVPGVIEVNPFGGELKTYEVQLKPDQLSAYGVSVGDVFEALEHNNANAGGAYIEHNGEQYLVRGEGQIASLDDIRDVVVRTDEDGTPVYVRQLGNVEFAPMVRQGAVTRDAKGEIVSANVMMLMGANSRQVVSDVKVAIEAMAPALSKLDVEIDAFYDRTELVAKTIHTVTRSLIEGGLLVMVVLFLMLRNVRAGLVVAVVIPLSMLVAFIGMKRFGVSGNLMSLGAIDFGLIVDGAVNVVENAVRLVAERCHHLGRKLTVEERSDAVLQASREVMRSAVFGVAIIAIVYLPILSLTGIEGKTFKPMAMTVLFALAGSLALALTLVPALATMLLPRRLDEKPSFIVAAAQRVYEPTLARAIRRRWVVVACAAALIVAAGLTYRTLGGEFTPKLDEGSLIVEDVRLPSVSLEESVRRNADVERILSEFPEVTAVVCKTGRPEIATDPMAANQTDVFVMLKPFSEWTSAGSREELIAKMDAALRAEIIGEGFGWSQPIEMRMSELIAGVRADVALKIYGDDLLTLSRTAERAASVIGHVPGAADVKAAQTEGLPVLRIDIDRRAIARYGINASDVLDVVAALGGRAVGTVIEGRRRFAMQVRFDASARKDIESIKSLKVRAPAGQLIPIGQLANVRLEEGPAEVLHELGRRFTTVQANVRGRDLAGFVADAKKAVAQADIVPAGYFVEWGGQFKNLEAATARLKIVVPIALFLIFVLLYAANNSVGLAALIYLNVPFAITGGIFALALRGMPFSITAGVGFIALFGVAVLNGLVLVSYIQKRRDEGATSVIAASEGARIRLRPVLTTALVASLGFIPMAFASGAGAEVQKPLATVVIGGLITSTVLTLLVLPTLYAWLFGRGRRLGDLPLVPALEPSMSVATDKKVEEHGGE